MSVTRPCGKGWGDRYSQVVRVSNGAQGATVHLAGQTAAPAPGSDEPQILADLDCYAQTCVILARVDRFLAAAGASKQHLVRAWVFLHDPTDVDECNRAWDEWMDGEGNLPARTCLVASPQLHTPHGLVEITVDAFVAAPADPTP
uniref:Uncharacterized protein n=1 Tax=Mantoniella antarctica TaxID=81844 RepID=A0A7S0SYV9_9CHLO|mmetsp:Transcript_1430/g.2197  ORF Transcript_1430/g.2197 Transcript_1430/m.2197 type:complete len:145 (+) Transcript_1430:80-514(+)